MSRADVHHPEDAIMTDAPKSAMRNDTEGFFKNESKMLDFTCSDVDSMRRLAE
jgi:hypothetical protein